MGPIASPLFRSAVPEEASTLSFIARTAKASWGYPPAWLDAWDEALHITSDYIAAHGVFVAENGGRIVALCAIEEHTDHWSLEHVWVLPGSQGQGIGAKLVQHARIAAASHRSLPVHIVSDPHAAAFYEQLGARRVGSVAAPMPGAPERTMPLFEFACASEPPSGNE